MRVSLISWLLGSVLLAALGQILFKIGATGQNTLREFVNLEILGGLLSYGIGTALWIISLSKAPLTAVYPFTALTFVIVYAAGVMYFGEATSIRALIGVVLILGGLFLVSTP
jgi:drug/metabolite transporter (DMT)-like permease